MKKITAILLIGITTLFFTACGGDGGNNNGGNTPAPPTTVNLVGTWNVSQSTVGGICDGLVAGGIEIIEPHNGNPDVMGVITLEGTKFDVDNFGNCYLAPMDIVDTTAVGTPSNMTEDQFIEWSKQRLAGIGTIDSFIVINYNQFIISVQVNLTNGVVIYQDLAR